MRRAAVFLSFGAPSATMLGSSFSRSLARTSSRPMGPQLLLTQQRLASHKELAEATLRELGDEQQHSTRPEKPVVPQGWTIEHKPGVLPFTMRRVYEDEEIAVRLEDVVLSSEETERTVNVFVINKGKALVFAMNVEEGEFTINKIYLRNDAKLALESSAEFSWKSAELYRGPDLSELEDGLLESFTSYLSSRGVDDTIASFIERFSVWAEQMDYEQWLSDINKFVS